MIIDEFNSRTYIALLGRFLAAGYTIIPAMQAMATPSPALMLRHDVDFSLIRAVAMAEAEHRLGISSTYYVMLANDFYNPIAGPSRRMVRYLVDLGHEVGLHWDSETYPSTREAALRQFHCELGVLESIVGQPIRTASQHRPASSDYLNFEDDVELEAYSSKVRERFVYVSDSAMRWREKTPLDYLNERRDVQLTVHPIWWFTESLSAEDKLREAVLEQHSLRDDLCERSIQRMHGALAAREANDAKFRIQRRWPND